MIKFWTTNFRDYELIDEQSNRIELKAPVVLHDAAAMQLATFFTNSMTINGLNVNDVVFTLMIEKRNENKV